MDNDALQSDMAGYMDFGQASMPEPLQLGSGLGPRPGNDPSASKPTYSCPSHPGVDKFVHPCPMNRQSAEFIPAACVMGS